jgi:hypothetical protein
MLRKAQFLYPAKGQAGVLARMVWFAAYPHSAIPNGDHSDDGNSARFSKISTGAVVA